MKAIGGLGPELDEDLSTTMMFMSHGYKGIYSMDTIALGHGPETFECAMRQEYQWSRSAVILHFRWRHIVHSTYKHFTGVLWLRTCTTMFWYLSQMAWSLWFLAGAVIGYYTDWCTDTSQSCTFSLINLLLRSLAPMIVSYGHIMWCRRRGWLRNGKLDGPKTPMLAPTVAVYRILRIIWMSLGVVSGFQELVFKRSSHFAVTPKGSNHVHVLSLRTLRPLAGIYLLLGTIFWGEIIFRDPQYIGLAIFIFILEVIFLLFLFFIIGMHYLENGIASIMNLLGQVALLFLCVGALVSTCVIKSSLIFNRATANMFIPSMIFSGELIVMVSLYGIVAVYTMLLTFFV